MNKLVISSGFLSGKILLTMKFIVIFMLASIFNSFAAGYAQNEKRTVKTRNATLKEVISLIEKQSDYVFFYKNEEVNQSQRFNLDVNEKSVKEILDLMTNNASLSYSISENYIFLNRREAPKKADYILYLNSANPLAVVEAKDNNHSISFGMQQAKLYAEMLDVKFAYSSNGDGFQEFDFLTGVEREISLEEFIKMPFDNDILIKIKVAKNGRKCFYQSVRNSKTDFPVLTCAGSVLNGKIRLVFGARPFSAVKVEYDLNLNDNSNSIENLAEFIANAAKEEVDVFSNMRGSKEYRTHLVGVLSKRAVLELGGAK